MEHSVPPAPRHGSAQFQGKSLYVFHCARMRPAMEDRRLLPAGGAGDPKAKLVPLVVKTEPDTKTRRVREEAKPTIPIRVKKEDLSEVPLKVPRFQYVDFPSLHQCIQQFTVPPLDSWLEDFPPALGRPSGGRTPVTSKERVPKFKYVDYPSLHHCIQQLSVPPLESWSSGLARSGCGVTGGPGSTTSQPSSVRGNQTIQGDGSASAHKQDKYTAFPFPGPDSGSIQCVTSSNKASHKPQRLQVSLSSPPRARPALSSQGEETCHKVVCSDQLSQKSSNPKSLVAGMKRVRGAEPLHQSNRKSAGDDDWHADLNKSPQSHQEAQVKLSDSPDLGQGFWRTIPVCLPLLPKDVFRSRGIADPPEESQRKEATLMS
ncbi:unnamed protein product [Coregonus sp. 'balchen']|nr:unnamed protein product [Coregonus sp. 'balchen']